MITGRAHVDEQVATADILGLRSRDAHQGVITLREASQSSGFSPLRGFARQAVNVPGRNPEIVQFTRGE
jgi:hypothetical protein